MLTELFGLPRDIEQCYRNRLAKGFARVSEENASALAIEQLHAQVFLERADLATDGGLGQVQLLRRTRKTL